MTTSPRILYVTPVSPLSQASGAEQRSALLLRALLELGTVDVLQLAPGTRSHARRDEVANLHYVQGEVAGGDGLLRYRPKPDLTAALESALGRTLAGYDLIVGRYLWSLCQLVLPAGVPTIIDLDDFRYRYAPQAGWSLPMLKERLVKAVNHQLARRQLHRFDAAFVVSRRDMGLLGKMPIALLSNVPWVIPSQVTPVPGGHRVLFVGSLWYRPNSDGIDWFLAEVWPLVHTSCPEATLCLVGPAPPARRAGWEQHAGVSAPGFVEDLAAAYATSNLVVAPIFSGGGTNIKVLEAMGHGRACLTTPMVSAAFSDTVVVGRHLLVANSAPEFAESVISALRNPAVLQRVADEGRRMVQSKFSTDAFHSTAVGFMRQLIDGGLRPATASEFINTP